MESFLCPKVARNCSRVIGTPSFCKVSRHEIQWNSSESIRVPSMSQSTARTVLIARSPTLVPSFVQRNLVLRRRYHVVHIEAELLRQLFEGSRCSKALNTNAAPPQPGIFAPAKV